MEKSEANLPSMLPSQRRHSFYDRYIRHKKIRLDMVIGVIIILLLQVSLFSIIRHYNTSNTATIPTDYYSHNMYSSSMAPWPAPSSGYYGHSRKPDLGFPADTINVNSVVNELTTIMLSHIGRYGMFEDISTFISSTNETNDPSVTSQAEGAQPTPPPTRTSPLTQEELVEEINPKENSKVYNPSLEIHAMDTKYTRYLRSGSHHLTDSSSASTVAFDATVYSVLSLRFTNYGTHIKSNVTLRQAPSSSTGNDIIIKAYIADDGDINNIMLSYRLNPEEVSVNFGQTYSFRSSNNGMLPNLKVDVIFPSQLKSYNSVLIETDNGIVYFHPSLENIQFNKTTVIGMYGSVVAERLVSHNIILSMFNGYISGLFKVSHKLGASVQHGFINAWVKPTLPSLQVAIAAKQGSAQLHLAEDSFKGQIDVLSHSLLPSLFLPDVSALTGTKITSSPVRIRGEYRSLFEDGYVLVATDQEALVRFVKMAD